MRILSVVASCVSIVAGLMAFYLYLSMREKVFRHHLILLLLSFDFGKALVLLWYPARVLLVPSAYDNVNFCEVVGFFTSTFIEAADVAVLALAIHTALLIYKKDSGKEGGLYQYRYYFYTINFVLPLVMASLAFTDRGKRTYSPLTTWCYLPIKPFWYRLVLSWIPRYIILTSILAIYLSIYIYVKLEYNKVMKSYKQSQSYLQDSTNPEGEPPQPVLSRLKTFFKPSSPSGIKEPFSAKQTAIKIISPVCRFISNFPGLSFLDPSRLFHNPTDSTNDIDMAIRDFQKDALANFQTRRIMIERQIQTIFLYPIAYVFLWIAPFAAHLIQYRNYPGESTVYWISAIASFMQPFNCAVDTLVFCIRERPWVDRKEVIFTSKNAEWIRTSFWRMIPCASPERKRRVSTTSVMTASEAGNTQLSCSTAGNPFATFDTDIERFANRKRSTSTFGGKHGRKSSSMGAVNLGTDLSTDTYAMTWNCGESASNHNASHGISRNTTLRQDDPFASTAHRVELGSDAEDGDEDSSEGEMDLMEFLR